MFKSQVSGSQRASMQQDLKKAPDFQNLTFERAVDSIRSAATIHLWKIVTKEPKAASIERMRSEVIEAYRQ
uniref:Uncharacterized protein n=1 Tax=Physcomitrium patens TaxID=3218 RepID=A0A2K1JPG4_PHYPA|nr:hypothetical protein PHYPA_015676 [Physcomitrium patens]